MAGPTININRYRLITLLYVIFVCLSVLNIPVSLLDSNYHLIKTLEYQEKSRLRDVAFANEVINAQESSRFKDTAKIYIAIQSRIHSCFQVIDSIDRSIQKKFADDGSSVFKEFNSKRRMEDLLVKDSMLEPIRRALFALTRYLDTQPFQLDKSIKTLVPVTDTVQTQSGSLLEWDRYLFLHKPTAISYMQIKRIKVLLLDDEFVYQNAALRTINFVPAYYSESEKRAYVNRAYAQSTQVVDNKETIDSLRRIDSSINKKREDSLKRMEQRLEKQQNELSRQEKEKEKASNNKSAEQFDDFFQQIITSMHAEHLYVGISNAVLQDFKYVMGKDFMLEIMPDAEVSRSNNDYAVVFKKSGDYVFRFTDKRNGANKMIFEKKAHVSLLPNPIVRLSGDNNLKDLISVKDLFNANRLSATIGVNDLTGFPGRITGFRVTRITKTKEQASVYNYSEVFQPAVQNLIRGLEKGDLVLFDRVTLTLQDGTTRSSNSIVYKIDE